MNKKKIRGWKRQIKKLEQWKQNHLQLSLNYHNYDHVKIWLYPWNNLLLKQRNPPVWFRRLIVAALIEIYDSWHEQLVALGEPFYLKIWFSEPRFIQSQVVAATGGRIEWYETLFEPDTVSKKFPFEKYTHGNYDLTAFDWKSHVDADYYFEKSDIFTAEKFEHLKKKAFRVWQTNDGETVLIIKRGSIFVGDRTSNKSIDGSVQQ
jgi:hypothetical protein